uniref:B-cell receptor CD22 n=1 Tax=Esox lucius TaxID=8010 RepID=A0A3P8YW20_ESOLU
MALTTAVHVLVFTLLYVAVVLGQKGWGVTYSTQSICALKGSTVEVSCSYTFPSGTVKSTYWFINSNVNVNLIGYSDYRGRVTYRNHTNNNNTLIITDLRQSDSAQYWFRFITVKPGNQWTGTPAVTLSVTGLQVGGTPATVTEGQNVTLTCITSCPLTDNPTCIWYKKNVTSQKASGQSYSITNITSEDSGEYYCVAQNIYGRPNSSTVSVDVQYSPKNTSVSVSPSGEIVEGNSVTLTCSSDANPPVDKYTWYKKPVTSPKASGQSYSITNITSEDSGDYYCEAENKYGRLNSSSVYVDVQYAPKNTSVSVSPSGEIIEGSSVTLTCSSDANPPVDKYTWYKKTVTSPKASGQNYSITNITSEDSGEYYCVAQNKYGHLNSSPVSVDVQYAPKNISVSVSPSGEIVEGSSVTLTCSSDAKPPVDKYTWYKKNVTLTKESGQSYNITNIKSEDSGEYYCEATNAIGNRSSDLICFLVLGKQSYEMLVVGISVVFLVLILCLSGFICFRQNRKKAPKSVSDVKDKSDNEQGNANPTYSNISSVSMTSEKRDQPDDLHYTSVDIHRAKMQEVPLYSTVQPQEQDEDVQYAAMKFNPPSSATQPVTRRVEEEPSVFYSTVNNPRTKMTRTQQGQNQEDLNTTRLEPRGPEHNKP